MRNHTNICNSERANYVGTHQWSKVPWQARVLLVQQTMWSTSPHSRGYIDSLPGFLSEAQIVRLKKYRQWKNAAQHEQHKMYGIHMKLVLINLGNTEHQERSKTAANMKETLQKHCTLILIFLCFKYFKPRVLWHCWLGVRKIIRPVKKIERWDADVIICLERGANDLHMVQLMPPPHHLLLH